MVYLGIDPGLSGAIAFIFEDNSAYSYRMPVLEMIKNKKKKRTYDIKAIKNLIETIQQDHTVSAIIENVHTMPNQGVTSQGMVMYGKGVLEAVLTCLGVSYTLVSPVKWKNKMLPGQKGLKDASRLKAQQLFPDIDLHLKKDHDRAEALLLAEYLRRNQ